VELQNPEKSPRTTKKEINRKERIEGKEKKL
jgi:hypothetical protein